jgi:hypothetical protein
MLTYQPCRHATRRHATPMSSLGTWVHDKKRPCPLCRQASLVKHPLGLSIRLLLPLAILFLPRQALPSQPGRPEHADVFAARSVGRVTPCAPRLARDCPPYLSHPRLLGQSDQRAEALSPGWKGFHGSTSIPCRQNYWSAFSPGVLNLVSGVGGRRLASGLPCC